MSYEISPLAPASSEYLEHLAFMQRQADILIARLGIPASLILNEPSNYSAARELRQMWLRPLQKLLPPAP